jgi:hypothetical protein
MKTTYESFEELAGAMTRGEGRLHQCNCPGEDECLVWQTGVSDFAEFLDHIGLKVSITDQKEDFYAFMSKRAKSRWTCK